VSTICRSSAIFVCVTSFVYISETKVRLGAIQSEIITLSTILVYVSEAKVRLDATLYAEIRSTTKFDFILPHLFTFQSLKLG